MTAAAPPRRRAGQEAVAETLHHQDRAAPRSALARGLGAVVGADPLDAGARAAFSAALGARAVGRHLDRLAGGLHVRAEGRARWHVLHSVPLGTRTLDHVVVGPGGVVVVRSAHLPGSRVRAARGALVVDGRRRPLLGDAHDDAQHLQHHLAASTSLAATLSGASSATATSTVTAVVAVVGAERVSTGRPGSVAVLSAARLVRWAQRRPEVLDPAAVEAVAAALRAPAVDADPQHQRDQLARFEQLRSRVRTADQVRRAWQVALAVGVSSGAVVALVDLLG